MSINDSKRANIFLKLYYVQKVITINNLNTSKYFIKLFINCDY